MGLKHPTEDAREYHVETLESAEAFVHRFENVPMKPMVRFYLSHSVERSQGETEDMCNSEIQSLFGALEALQAFLVNHGELWLPTPSGGNGLTHISFFRQPLPRTSDFDRWLVGLCKSVCGIFSGKIAIFSLEPKNSQQGNRSKKQEITDEISKQGLPLQSAGETQLLQNRIAREIFLSNTT